MESYRLSPYRGGGCSATLASMRYPGGIFFGIWLAGSLGVTWALLWRLTDQVVESLWWSAGLLAWLVLFFLCIDRFMKSREMTELRALSGQILTVARQLHEHLEELRGHIIVLEDRLAERDEQLRSRSE